MALKFGADDVDALYLGADAVDAAYLGVDSAFDGGGGGEPEEATFDSTTITFDDTEHTMDEAA